MLSLAEYTAAAAELESIAQGIEAKTGERISNLTKAQAIKVAKDLAETYQEEYRELLEQSMQEAAENAAEYYARQVDRELDTDEIANRVIKNQWAKKYYGLTLAQRLAFNYKVLQRRISQSAQLGAEKLEDVYTQTFPFGAHAYTDKRVLLGTLVKIEQDIAKEVALQKDIPFIRWTLSHRHAQPDICDDLANNIDKATVNYLNANNLTHIEPKGLYLVDRLPNPPHPNCQCEHMLVSRQQEQKRSPVKRALNKARNLIRRIMRK